MSKIRIILSLTIVCLLIIFSGQTPAPGNKPFYLSSDLPKDSVIRILREENMRTLGFIEDKSRKYDSIHPPVDTIKR
ncbi:hypothetical protein SAMN05428988_3235 [Chitinophaga sp. YR573]|uniref:hypothetical protein n=1 Tax=Chitinophaga sp. YR573 TaxID=1881040 RepID=UPI0008BDC602|nr:hypothetical protein [Chitinophaga sp. YR573]SEW21665.1 hypothetical protein SAMN05428988_3235 [Chitinophaga sp. YR573]